MAEVLDEADGEAADAELSADAVPFNDGESGEVGAGADVADSAGVGPEVSAVGVHPVTTSRADAATIMTVGVGGRFKRGTGHFLTGSSICNPIHSGAAGTNVDPGGHCESESAAGR